jgi:uncharacterized lipoprotein YddW (UPF0748 family)
VKNERAKDLGIIMQAFVACGILFLVAVAPAWGQPLLAVLRSDRNAQEYSDQHIGNFDEDWLNFKRTLESANLRYDLITDNDLRAGSDKLSLYKLVIVPFLVDVSPEGAQALRDYTGRGGKILVTDGGGTPTERALAVLSLCGVSGEGRGTMREARSLVWARMPLPVNIPFAVGTTFADAGLASGASAPARWVDASGHETPAVVRLGNNFFLAWAPGMQGEITSNSQLLTFAMEDAVPGITQMAAVQISYADYQTIKDELAYLSRRTDETIKTAKQADLSVPGKIIQGHYEAAEAHVKKFEDAYVARRYFEADTQLAAARQEYALAFAKSMPVRPVEGRAIWLDRGTIVACRDARGMARLFDRLKSAGINIVYFETNNAGFCTFPSRLSVSNPETSSWDPLGCAVEEAHRHGMELHSWIWTFAVGNIRHNPIIAREADYPGPVLSTQDCSWALAARTGSFLPHNQPEFWIDPCNPAGRRFVKDLAAEVVSRYPVDGVQFDYIRYPFNGKGTEMGFDWSGRLAFERETGLNLDRLDDGTRQVWQAWKTAQVNRFVEETSNMLRKLRPGLRISAAVYATPLRLRLLTIQQEWETWVKNGWVDTLNPMTYQPTAKELAIAAGNVRESAADRALVYPGLSIRQLDTAGLIEQLDTARAIGTLGSTMFAVAQLDDKKVDILRLGPYRRYPQLVPQADPVRACRLLVDDFTALVNRYLQDPAKHIISDRASTNEVLVQMEALRRDIHSLRTPSSADDLDAVHKQVTNLQSLVREWLRIEAFVQRGFRAQYIVSYLQQVDAILAYATHKARTQNVVISGT